MLLSRKHLLAFTLSTLFALNASGATLYVWQSSPNPTPPYDGPLTAARAIQDAIHASTNGDLILVMDGVYNTGSYDCYGLNRVVATNAVTIRSIYGPAVTTIQGNQVGGTGNGPGAVRCAFLVNGASLSGFTLTGGGTIDTGFLAYGGAVYCQSDSATLSNCVLQANTAGSAGGGAYRGTLFNCLIRSNTASSDGGGAAGSVLRNCLVAGNFARVGAGAAGGSVLNSTVACNTATNSAGGTSMSALYNSIIYHNTAPSNPNYTESLMAMLLFYCCTTPNSMNALNFFTNAPLFVDPAAGDFRLQANSPCINSGHNKYMTNLFDLDQNSRISGGTVDVGAYEFQNPASQLSYVWAQSHGFPTDGSADFLDADGDGANNWQECLSGTIGTNAASVLKLTSIVPDASGVSLTWTCIKNKSYYIERSMALNGSSAFSLINSNIPGLTTPTMTLRDNQATGSGPYFYRIGVHQDR